MSEPEPLKLYYDYKSPYAYLAAEPAFDLPARYRVNKFLIVLERQA